MNDAKALESADALFAGAWLAGVTPVMVGALHTFTTPHADKHIGIVQKSHRRGHSLAGKEESGGGVLQQRIVGYQQLPRVGAAYRLSRISIWPYRWSGERWWGCCSR